MVSVTIRQLVGESSAKETRTYKISCQPEYLDKIETLFRWMNMTAGGHSGTAQISIDGDGRPRVKIEKEDGELYKPDEDFEPNCSGKAEFKVDLA